MTHKSIVIGVLGLIVLGLGAGAWFLSNIPSAYSRITSYEECVAAGYPVLESYPEQCKLPDGRTFVRDIQSNVSDLIHVTSPQSGNTIQSPLVITGEARGTWYFEAVFPVKLLDANGTVIAQGQAQAEGEWMTENFVPFKANLIFSSTSTGPATLVLENDNSSGLPENGKQISIPVQLSGASSSATTTITLGKATTFRVGTKVSFSPDVSLTLKEVNDSRCKPNVQCIWQGEISALFSVTVGGASKELRLGTVTSPSSTFGGYAFTLQSATPESVVVIVKASAALASGITGFIHIGPTCPVERTPPDPNCGDKPYEGAKVLIRKKGSTAVVSQLVSDTKGNFKVVLVPGTYIIHVSSPTNTSLPYCETKEAVVKTNQFISVDVSCDSGIR